MSSHCGTQWTQSSCVEPDMRGRDPEDKLKFVTGDFLPNFGINMNVRVIPRETDAILGF